jgi:hypothetical protein
LVVEDQAVEEVPRVPEVTRASAQLRELLVADASV